MSNTSPMPWSVGREWIEDGDGSEIEVFSVLDANNQPVTDQPISYGDASCMAASRDLLDALESALTILTDSVGDFDHEKAEAAIAKAKGEKQ